VDHCVVEMIIKCLDALCANPSTFYVIKMHYACEGVVLKKDASRLSKQKEP